MLTVVAGAVARAMVPTLSRAVAAGQAARAQDTAARLTRLTVGAVVLVAATDLLAGYAHARGRFLLAGAQGVPFNLVMIGAAAGLGPLLGIDGLALGFVLASAARLLLLLVATRGLGRTFLVPQLRLGSPDVLEVARLVPALVVVTSLTGVNTTVDRAVGSLAGEGAVTALNLAWRTVSLVDSLLVATVVAVLYPLLGAAAGFDGGPCPRDRRWSRRRARLHRPAAPAP